MISIEAKSEKAEQSNLVFDHHDLRLSVGIIAFGLPVFVYLITGTITSSISASYHTDARDVFVGSLCVIAVLLIAYQGYEHESSENTIWSWVRKYQETMVSKLGGFAALAAALSPTTCDGCVPNLESHIHTAGAIILFSTVVYFCLVAFLRRAFAKFVEDGSEEFSIPLAVKYALQGDGRALSVKRVKDQRRLRFYLVCGLLIAGIMLFSIFTSNTLKAWDVIFWAETFALIIFGFAWMVASQIFPWFTDVAELHNPLKRLKRLRRTRA